MNKEIKIYSILFIIIYIILAFVFIHYKVFPVDYSLFVSGIASLGGVISGYIVGILTK